jgi:hypothetical protein
MPIDTACKSYVLKFKVEFWSEHALDAEQHFTLQDWLDQNSGNVDREAGNQVTEIKGPGPGASEDQVTIKRR